MMSPACCLGSGKNTGFFPNAKLLGHRQEWISTGALLPCQADWFCPNGVGADAYAPLNSRINSVRRYAQATGVEGILNGNTLEGSNDQYISILMEKTVAGSSKNPDFPNCATSSEATPHWTMAGQESRPEARLRSRV